MRPLPSKCCALGLLLLLSGACAATRSNRTEPSLDPRPERLGDEIVVCGERVHTGAPVVLWFDEGGYSAYDTRRTVPGGPIGLRYRPGREAHDPAVARHDLGRAELEQVLDLFVLHYDVCGTSRTCFRVLQAERGLSVHFLLDVDGTIYQTLDLADTAWHATKANGRSVGVEIAHVGAYPPGAPSLVDEFYGRDVQGERITLPERFGDGGVRTPRFVGRPARAGRFGGTINGEQLEQPDFTPEQYRSLALLTAALVETFPRMRADAPREASGEVRNEVLADDVFSIYRGVLGHYHVQANKADPGPAFNWEGYLDAVQAILVKRGVVRF